MVGWGRVGCIVFGLFIASCGSDDESGGGGGSAGTDGGIGGATGGSGGTTGGSSGVGEAMVYSASQETALQPETYFVSLASGTPSPTVKLHPKPPPGGGVGFNERPFSSDSAYVTDVSELFFSDAGPFFLSISLTFAVLGVGLRRATLGVGDSGVCCVGRSWRVHPRRAARSAATRAHGWRSGAHGQRSARGGQR